jgi:hypothetical protein
MKIVDIADEIFRDLGEPAEISIPPIAYWLRANVGKLNTLVFKQYFVDDATLEVMCVNPNDPTTFEEIGEDEKTIFKLLYILHYYDLQIRKNMLNFNTSKAIEITDGGHTVRLASPTEIGKTLAGFRKTIATDLSSWVTHYRTSRSTPRQVTGDDTVEATLAPPEYRTPYYF